MAKKNKAENNVVVMSGDFETETYEGIEETKVWLGGFCELGTEKCEVFLTIDDCFRFLFWQLETRGINTLIVYYHNLKFDGTFWLDFLKRRTTYCEAFDKNANEWLKKWEMPLRSYEYTIADTGQWYLIRIRIGGNQFIEFRDSLKLLPFSLKAIGKNFNLKHQKLEMEYEGKRESGAEPTHEELEYFKNDLYVLKEALEYLYSVGSTKLTIGSCCLAEYKEIVRRGNPNNYPLETYRGMFPDLTKMHFADLNYLELDNEFDNLDAYIRKSYRGGYCYCNPEFAHQKLEDGQTYDVNSLYPYVMLAGNYPIGNPIKVWQGAVPKDVMQGAERGQMYYFLRVRCSFYIKPKHLPIIQIKGAPTRYDSTEYLVTSDILGKDNHYHRYIEYADGEKELCTVTMTLTMTDWALINEHYYLENVEYLDGVAFYSKRGIFDDYINKYRGKKENASNPCERQLAKLYLNNLYGKMASGDRSDFKVYHIDDDLNALRSNTYEAHDKASGYIAIGSAITSYAREYTIRAAQANFERFCYADTDSIHLIGKKPAKNVQVDNKEFGKWKIEKQWKIGYFVRQKTYIEIGDDGMDIKCAGMPQKCKRLFELSLKGKAYWTESDWTFFSTLDDDERLFCNIPRTLSDFDYGLIVPGKLRPKIIPGGTVLEKTTFEMKQKCLLRW